MDLIKPEKIQSAKAADIINNQLENSFQKKLQKIT